MASRIDANRRRRTDGDSFLRYVGLHCNTIEMNREEGTRTMTHPLTTSRSMDHAASSVQVGVRDAILVEDERVDGVEGPGREGVEPVGNMTIPVVVGTAAPGDEQVDPGGRIITRRG